MGLPVFWTRFAEDKLQDLYTYHELNAGVKTSKKLALGIINESLRLEKHPKLGQAEPLLAERPENFRYLIYKNYKIIYWNNKIRNRV